jgi:hypothetical protein
MTVYAAGAHAHVQRLVSVFKMATIVDDYVTEKQQSFVRFFIDKRTRYKSYS